MATEETGTGAEDERPAVVAEKTCARPMAAEASEDAALASSAVPASEKKEAAASIEEDAMCRYCFEGASTGELISPCGCAGGQKYVHLACLRMWQRAVLGSQPTHPDFYDTDTRQRICNVCKEEFTCPPPTRAELMESFTGPELAALIEEGSLIGSSEGFSSELELQLSMVSQSMRPGIVCQHWVKGMFLIVKVAKERNTEVLLALDDREDLDALLERLRSNGRSLQLRGRTYSIVAHGPLQEANLTADSSRDQWREALSQLEVPVTLAMQAEGTADCGEDGVLAVNMCRPFDISERAGPASAMLREQQRSAFCPLMRDTLLAGETPMPLEVCHFSGGPCEEEEVAACMVIADGTYSLVKDGATLKNGLRLAAANARALQQDESAAIAGESDHGSETAAQPAGSSNNCQAATEKQAKKRCRAPLRGIMKARFSMLKRKRAKLSLLGRRGRRAAAPAEAMPRGESSSATSSVIATSPSAAECEKSQQPGRGRTITASTAASSTPPSAVKLHVFWGYAGWSRCQLMGEIARGSWGLCQARPEEILRHSPGDLWEAVYPRMVLSPKNEMSETYGGQGADAARRRDLRRMAIFHDILRRHREALIADQSTSEEEENQLDEGEAGSNSNNSSSDSEADPLPSVMM